MTHPFRARKSGDGKVEECRRSGCGNPLSVTLKKRRGEGDYYCSRRCYLQSRRREEVNCARCGDRFYPTRVGRKFCSRECYAKEMPVPPVPANFFEIAAKPLEKYVAECEKGSWRGKEDKDWSILDVWQFVSDELRKRYQYPSKFLDAKGMAQLRQIHKNLDDGFRNGMRMQEVVRIVRFFVENFRVYWRRFEWVGAFHPGILLSYWDNFRCDCNRGQIESREPLVDLEALIRVKLDKVKVRHWWAMSRSRWRETTMWWCVYDTLRSKGVPVAHYHRESKKRLLVLYDEYGRDEVYAVAQNFYQVYEELEEEYSWVLPFRVTTFCGFFKTIRYKVRQEVTAYRVEFKDQKHEKEEDSLMVQKVDHSEDWVPVEKQKEEEDYGDFE